MFKRIKTTKLIFFLIFLSIIFLILYSYLENVVISQNNIPNIKKESTSYNVSRNEAVKQYLLSQKDFSWSTRDGSKRVCVFANLDENNLFPISIWVHCIEYMIKDGNIVELSGASLPALIDYPNELSFFDPLKMSHTIPRDGAYYPKDIKDIFSKQAQENIFKRSFQNEIRDLLISELN